MKKKLFLGILVVSATLAFVACGNKDRNKDNNSENKTENAQSNKKVADSALDLLQEVWDEYEDEEKFAVMGGDMENSVSDRPGKFAIEDAENLDYTLAFPEKSVDMIDDCASLMHMMNANNFTCGVFHLKDSGNVDKLADDLKENIENRQWICGQPDKYLIAQVGSDYVVSAFGSAEIMDTFKKNLKEEYEEAKILVEENIG